MVSEGAELRDGHAYALAFVLLERSLLGVRRRGHLLHVVISNLEITRFYAGSYHALFLFPGRSLLP